MATEPSAAARELIGSLLTLWAAPGPWSPGESTREGLIRVSLPLVDAFAAARVTEERERISSASCDSGGCRASGHLLDNGRVWGVLRRLVTHRQGVHR